MTYWGALEDKRYSQLPLEVIFEISIYMDLYEHQIDLLLLKKAVYMLV